MKLLNLNKKLFFSLIIFVFFTPLLSEESVDIWEKKNLNKKSNSTKTKDIFLKKPVSNININIKPQKEIEINTGASEISKNLVYGIFDPDVNNLNLNMWVNSEGTRVKDTIERINKINLDQIFRKLNFY